MFLTILSDGSLSDEPYSGLPDTKPFSPWVKHQGEIFYADFPKFFIGSEGLVRLIKPSYSYTERVTVVFTNLSEIEFIPLPDLKPVSLCRVSEGCLTLEGIYVPTDCNYLPSAFDFNPDIYKILSRRGFFTLKKQGCPWTYYNQVPLFYINVINQGVNHE